MPQVIAISFVISLAFTVFVIGTARAQGDQYCSDPEPPDTVQTMGAHGVESETQEYTQGSPEWWFEKCHGVIVKKFCRPKNFFSVGQTQFDDVNMGGLGPYAQWLRIMNYQPFSALVDKYDEAYRFFWWPSFFSPPTVILITSKGDDRRFTGSQFCIGNRKERPLTDEEWTKVHSLLADAKFWTLPARGGGSGLDGGEWLFEGYENKRYHVVKRWSPLGTPLATFGKYLLELSEFDPPVIQ